MKTDSNSKQTDPKQAARKALDPSNLLWIGWFAMIIGLAFPMLHMPPLMDIYGYHIAIFVFAAGFLENGPPNQLLVTLTGALTLLPAFIAPTLIRVRAQQANMVLAMIFGMPFLVLTIPALVILFVNPSELGFGLFFWIAGFLLLCLSRIQAARLAASEEPETTD